MKQLQWTIVKWLLAVGLVAGILYWRWDALNDAVAQLRAGLDPDRIVTAFAAAGLAYLGGMCCTFVRWWLLVRAQGLPFRLIDAVRLNFASLFFSIFLPGSIGGDLIKAGLIAQEQERRTIAIATIIVDRIVGLYGLFVLTSLAGVMLWLHLDAEFLRMMLLGIWGVFICVPLVVLVVMLLPFDAIKWIAWLRQGGRPKRIVAELFFAFHMYRRKIHYVLVAVTLATVGHVGFVWSFYLSATALPQPIPSAADHAILIPVYRVAQSVPFVPGGIGQNEAVGEFLYQFVEPESEAPRYQGKGALAVLAGRMVDYSMALLGLLFYVPLRATVQRVIDERSQELSVNGAAVAAAHGGGVSAAGTESAPCQGGLSYHD